MKIKDKPTAGTLLIRGKELDVITRNLEQEKLRFYAENPRVYSVLHSSGKSPAQEEIQAQLLKLEHVRDLIQDIKVNGGLLEPLIVRDESFDVLEGNSRLAAYRFLAKSDPIKWGMVKCTVLPKSVDDSLVFALLGQFHIKGKKDWAPYEQAGFLYRRFKKHKTDIKTLATELGISSKRVKHLIDVYAFMVEKSENDVGRWSYFDEYLKSTKIRRARVQYPQLDDIIVEKVRRADISRAMDLRDQLPVICSSPIVLSKFIAGNQDFGSAYERAQSQGGDTVYLNKIKRFRELIAKPETMAQCEESEGKIRSATAYELKKIETRVHAILKKLQN